MSTTGKTTRNVGLRGRGLPDLGLAESGRIEAEHRQGLGAAGGAADDAQGIPGPGEARRTLRHRDGEPGGGERAGGLADLVAVEAGEVEVGDAAARRALLVRALEQPFRILLGNSGLNPDEWLPQVKKAKAGQGVDVNTPTKLVDLKAAGVVDPTRVTKEALQNAVSIAGTAMTMGALVVEVPEPKSAGGPDMNGMGM